MTTTHRNITGTEHRVNASHVEIREANDGTPGFTLTGLMVPFAAPATVNDGAGSFVETFRSTSFDRMIAAGTLTPVLLVGHNRSGVPLAKAPNTMQLMKQADGIHFTASLSPTSHTANDVADAVRRGDLPGVSLSFWPSADRWTMQGDVEHREIIDVESCSELSLTPFPAYPTTHVSARSLDVTPAVSARLRRDITRAAHVLADLRVGKKVSAENLQHLTSAVAHVQTVIDSVGPVGGADGTGSSLPVGAGPGASTDGTGGRSSLAVELDLIRFRTAARL